MTEINIEDNPITTQPLDIDLSADQIKSLCLGLVLGRKIDKTPERAENNEGTVQIFAKSYTNTYNLVFVTNKDGNPRHPASVSVYLLGGEAAPSISIPELNIEFAMKNLEAQPFFSSSSLPAPISSLSLKSTRDFVLNHCPIISISLVDPPTGITIAQDYSPAHANTSEDGSVTLYHEQNLRVKIDHQLSLYPGIQLHLFDMSLTWKESETLYMADTQEEEEFSYLCGEIQIEAGRNTYYPSDSSRIKVTATPCALMFGDPSSRQTQKEIETILSRGTDLPANTDVLISSTETSEIKGGFIEYTMSVPYDSSQTGEYAVSGSGGFGSSWSVEAPASAAEVYPVRHRFYVVDSGNWNTEVKVYTADGSPASIAVGYKIVSEPTVPRPASGQTKYYKSKLALVDEATITVRTPQIPERDEHLVLVDDADFSAGTYVPPDRDEHLVLVDDADFTVIEYVPPERDEHLALADDVDLEVVEHPVPQHSDSLSLVDNTSIEVSTPPTPNSAEGLALNDTAVIETE